MIDERVGSGLNSMISIHYPQLLTKIFPPNLENFLFSFPLIHSFYRSSVRKTFSQHYSFFFFLSNPFLPTQKCPKGHLLSGHIDFFKEKEAPLLNSCPQRPLHRHLFPLLFPYLLNPSHQDSGPSTLPSGLSLLLGFFFFFLIGLSLILWGLCSLMIHCLWKLKLGSQWLWMILIGLSLSRLLMPIALYDVQ